MVQTSISVFLMCKLCRGSFGQVDSFIEHKKQKHFTQFQNTTSIVFEETDNNELLCPVTIKAEAQPTNENNEPPIKIEMNDDDPVIPFSSEIIDEPNLGLVEHRKEEHFARFLQTSCIVFEKEEQDLLCPVITNAENQPTDENNETSLKIEVTNGNPISHFSSEIIDEPNMGIVEPKSEQIIFETEITPKTENDDISLKQPEQNPYVLLKRLTSEEIQRASNPKQHSRLIKSEEKTFANDSESLNASEDDSNISDGIEVEKSTEIQSTSTVINVSTEPDAQFECKLCSKQLESDAQLKTHVGMCARGHKDRNRFCVPCNKKLNEPRDLKEHRLRFHARIGEEKLSLYKLKCHLCPMRYKTASGLSLHLNSHKAKKHPVSTSESKPFKCLQPKCGKAFRNHADLRTHNAIHSFLRPFSCSMCNKTFAQSYHLKEHSRFHTGERAYKCTVGNCKKTFTTFAQLHLHSNRSARVHRN